MLAGVHRAESQAMVPVLLFSKLREQKLSGAKAQDRPESEGLETGNEADQTQGCREAQCWREEGVSHRPRTSTRCGKQELRGGKGGMFRRIASCAQLHVFCIFSNSLNPQGIYLQRADTTKCLAYPTDQE